MPLVSVAAVHLRRIDAEAIGEVGLLDSDGDRAKLARGDLLIVEGNGSLEHIGRVALWNEQVSGARHQNHIIRVRPHEVSSRFALEWLASPAGREAIVSEATSGAGLYTLSLSKVERLPIPVPPQNEQRRIVAKLEALQARSRRAREALDAVPALLETLRQSILAAAFRGDLTKDWREKHKDVEPASKLLERIRAERRKEWEEAEHAKMVAKGKTPTDERWKAKYKEPERVDAEGLLELPEGWCWASVDELCPGDAPAVYGIILPGDDVPNGVPYVRPVDMRNDGTVDFRSIKRTTVEIASQYARSSLRTGDVVLSIVGTIGKVMVVPLELDGANITQSSARIRPARAIASAYMGLALRSPLLTRQFDTFRFGNAVQRLNVEHVRRLRIPLAPTPEQAAIVQRAEMALGALPGVLVAKLEGQVDVLDRAILAKAFCGELVPQDPSDEPAETMLARLGKSYCEAEAFGKGRPNGARRVRARRGA